MSLLPPGTCQNEFLTVPQLLNAASDLPGSNLIARDLNALGICWLTLSAPNYAFHSLETNHHGSWTKHVTEKRNRDVSDLIFTEGITYVQTYIETNLPECDHLFVGCSLTLPLNMYPSHNLGPYFRDD